MKRGQRQRQAIRKAQADKLRRRADQAENMRKSRVKLTGTTVFQQKRQLVPDIQRQIERLPGQSLRDVVQQWRNAIQTLENPGKAHLHSHAKKLLAAIDKDWQRRRADPNPDDWFPWPNTDAPKGLGTVDSSDWPDLGMLKFMGYTVGRTNGVPEHIRHAILSRVFESELPPALPPDKLAEWSTPKAAYRLKKMAESIASFARNAKRHNDGRQDDAIRDWENDLEFLKVEYYIGHFSFGFPSTLIL